MCLLNFGSFILADLLEWLTLEEIGKLTFLQQGKNDYLFKVLHMKKYSFSNPPEKHFMNKDRLFWCLKNHVRLDGAIFFSNFLAYNFPVAKLVELFDSAQHNNITSIIANNITSGSAVTLVKLINSLALHLTKVELRNLKMTQGKCEEVLRAIGACSAVSDLTFIPGKIIQSLDVSNLSSLSFRSLVISGCTGKSIEQLLTNSPNITKLDVQHCPGVSNCSLVHVLDKLDSLVHLNISNNEHFLFISSVLQHAKNLTHLSVSNIPSSLTSVVNSIGAYDTHIQYLDISKTKATDIHISRLFRNNFCTRLKSIDIRGSSITPIGAKQICDKCLDLNCVQFDDNECKLVFLLHFKEYEVLDMLHLKLVGTVFKPGEIAKSVEGRFLQNHGQFGLVHNVAYHIHFKNEVIWENLIEINFDCSALMGFDEHNGLLPHLLSQCLSLQTFHLSNSTLTDSELKSLSFTMGTSLQTVGLFNCCCISDVGVQCLIDNVKSSLVNFFCKKCCFVTVTAFAYVMESCCCLRRLVVTIGTPFMAEFKRSVDQLVWNAPMARRPYLTLLINEKMFEYDTVDVNSFLDLSDTFT